MSAQALLPQSSPPPPVLETVLGYALRGWPVFPVHTEDENGCSCGKTNCDSPGKHPRTLHGLHDATRDEAQIGHWAQQFPGCNWAVATGPRAGVFVFDVDPGGEQSLAAWEQEHGADWTKTLRAKTPRGDHFYFQYPANLEADGFEIVNSTKKIAPEIDIRGKGGYVIVAPSRRRDLCYRWVGDGLNTPILPAPDGLLQLVRTPTKPIESAQPLATHGSAAAIPEGQRNTMLASLAGAMRRRGASPATVEAALQVENVERCNPPLSADEVSKTAASVSRYVPESEEPWPDPQNIDCSPVDPFTLDLLPPTLRPLVEDVSERMQTPPDFAAAAMLVALAGCVCRRAFVRPKQADFSWEMPLNLWGAIIAPPGFLKTPLVNTITKPLAVIESALQEENKQAMTRFELRSAQTKIAQEIWSRNYKQACERGAPRPEDVRPESEAPPAQQRLLVTDATMEKLHEILIANPAGVFVLRDELVGWLATLDKAGRESDRGFFLQSWSGDAGYAIDRIGRGSLFVPHVCVSLFGNIQPVRLHHYFSHAVADAAAPNNDGLFQRFQILVYPDVSANWTLVDRLPDANAIATAQRIFSHLAELPCESPLRLNFDGSAQELFNAWLGSLEKEIRAPADVPLAMVAHLAKYRGLLPKLAALFELCDRIAGGERFSAGQALEISLEHTAQASAVCKYLRSHARRIYGGIVSADMTAARELGGKLRQGKLPDPFTTRSVYRKCWTGLNTPERVRRALELLASFGWVRSIATTEEREGRPTEFWAINPKVVSQ
jgi:hypothetical protein